MSGLVVVGVDGSASSLASVEAAAMEAHWRGAGLRLVHAFAWRDMHPLGPLSLGPPENGLRDVEEPLLAEAEDRAAAVAPAVEVSRTVVTGEPLAVLEAQSRVAELVVVGSRGMSGFVALMVGSTGVQLAAHARCPVLVVRGRGEVTGPIVLGVDGSPAGAKAVDFAFAEAALRDVDIVVVHCWTAWGAPMPPPHDAAMPYANEPGALAAHEERVLAEAIAGRQERFPHVRVERDVVHGGTRETLIEASRRAQLLVVGARGHGGFTGLLLGSVSQAMLHHAHCPVAVVRSADDSR
ncbi:universal stress protein [Streptomyces sp. NPDC012510]|uniref:universal stress protein n=1 Tax=Streptomyces sp. NPDC012510 TaxID=3364838 RepID=UPI0036F145DB